MKTNLDCIPCFMQQALAAARMATDDEAVHEEVLRHVAERVSRMDMGLSPPVMAQMIHRLIRELTGEADPYLEAKRWSNRLANDLVPEILARLHETPETARLEMAVRAAIAGNIIDFGVHSDLHDDAVRSSVDTAFTAPLSGSIEAFAEEIGTARSILYIADNAGEIVFDRVLIEQLGPERVTLAVRGRPVLNDALRADAEAAGLTSLVEIIENGSDAPGTVLDDCSETFRSRFLGADVVLAKGQGNYETLSNAPRAAWFVLMAKCHVIARHIGCEPGSFIVERKPAAGR
jgi:hypothetical protein